jgi:hypothetical protein
VDARASIIFFICFYSSLLKEGIGFYAPSFYDRIMNLMHFVRDVVAAELAWQIQIGSLAAPVMPKLPRMTAKSSGRPRFG